ncbi:MAG: hypothetical protein R2769_08790 [Saprospiraceae bacterium]
MHFHDGDLNGNCPMKLSYSTSPCFPIEFAGNIRELYLLMLDGILRKGEFPDRKSGFEFKRKILLNDVMLNSRQCFNALWATRSTTDSSLHDQCR